MSISNKSGAPAVEVMRLSASAILPTSAYLTDVGLDLYADEDAFIKTGETAIIGTGIALGEP